MNYIRHWNYIVASGLSCIITANYSPQMYTDIKTRLKTPCSQRSEQQLYVSLYWLCDYVWIRVSTMYHVNRTSWNIFIEPQERNKSDSMLPRCKVNFSCVVLFFHFLYVMRQTITIAWMAICLCWECYVSNQWWLFTSAFAKHMWLFLQMFMFVLVVFCFS